MERSPNPVDMAMQATQPDLAKSMVLLQEGPMFDPKPRVQLFGSGAMLKEALAAAELLQSDFSVVADVWSVSSYAELHRDGLEAARWNRLHPAEPARKCFVESRLANFAGPFIAATDGMRAVPEQIRTFVGTKRYVTLGTDGFGASSTREALCNHFKADRHHVVVAALQALADEGLLSSDDAAKAIVMYGIDSESAALA